MLKAKEVFACVMLGPICLAIVAGLVVGLVEVIIEYWPLFVLGLIVAVTAFIAAAGSGNP